MNWLNSIFGLLKSIFGFGEKIAENKALKIPMQEDAIRSKADKRTQKNEFKIEKRVDRKTKKECFAEIRLLNLSIRQSRKTKKEISNIIRAGYEVVKIERSGEGAKITYIKDGLEKYTTEI